MVRSKDFYTPESGGRKIEIKAIEIDSNEFNRVNVITVFTANTTKVRDASELIHNMLETDPECQSILLYSFERIGARELHRFLCACYEEDFDDEEDTPFVHAQVAYADTLAYLIASKKIWQRCDSLLHSNIITMPWKTEKNAHKLLLAFDPWREQLRISVEFLIHTVSLFLLDNPFERLSFFYELKKEPNKMSSETLLSILHGYFDLENLALTSATTALEKAARDYYVSVCARMANFDDDDDDYQSQTDDD